MLLVRKPDEQLVAAHLHHCGYKNVLYEPDGNIPPDFLVDGSIAVEARRLNQHYDDGTGPKGLEDAISLGASVRNLLLSLGPPTYGQSWFVHYQFTRPLPTWNVLRPVLKPALLTFMAHAHSQPLDCEIVPGFRLKLWPATTVRQTFYLFGGYSDRQTTGYVIHEIEVNLRLCIEEKTRKVAAMRHKYPEWWLVLPDHIGWGLDEFDQESFRKQVSLIHSFDRVILLDPRDHTRAFKI